jgi:hypothetical protein
MNITKNRLAELNRLLGERDKAILRSLKKCRYLTFAQIARLHFAGNSKQSTILRSAQYAMVKLRGYELVESLERRIGGVRAGSGSYVWALSGSGMRLLSINNTESITRKRSFEPTPHFLHHTLAIS